MIEPKQFRGEKPIKYARVLSSCTYNNPNTEVTKAFGRKHCWKPWGLGLNQCTRACPTGPKWGKSLWEQSHPARTSGLWDSAEHCWSHPGCMFASLIILMGGFSVILSVTKGIDVAIPGNLIFFLSIFP